jgi:hypothetical protein
MSGIKLADLGPIEPIQVMDSTPPPHGLFDFAASLHLPSIQQVFMNPRVEEQRNDYFQPGGMG